MSQVFRRYSMFIMIYVDTIWAMVCCFICSLQCPAWKETTLTDTQETEGYLPSTQPQHITTNITLVTLTATNTSNHRCLWLIQWIQNVCNMFQLRILDFLNVNLKYEGNMCLQSVSNHSPNCRVTVRTTRTPNYNSVQFYSIYSIPTTNTLYVYETFCVQN